MTLRKQLRWGGLLIIVALLLVSVLNIAIYAGSYNAVVRPELLVQRGQDEPDEACGSKLASPAGPSRAAVRATDGSSGQRTV